MNRDPQIRELLTCALLHLDPRIVDKRIALNSVLIEVALFTINKPSGLEELQDEIDRIVNQKDFLREGDLRHAVKDCLSRGAVIDRGEKYELSAARREALRTAFLCADETGERVRSGLVESIELEIGNPLTPSMAREICESVERALTVKVYELSLQLARKNLSMEEMLLRLDAVEPSEDLERALDAHVPSDRQLLRQQIKAGIVNYFRAFTPDLEERLKLIHHTVLINQILNLDPSMVRLQRDWFSRRRFYLDTNAVLAYAFEGQELHNIVLEVIQGTINLQVQLLISPITLEELERQVARAKRDYLLYERDPLVGRMAANGDDAILATFVQIRRKQPSIEWEAFIAPFEDLEETLLQYNILVEEEGFDQARTSDGLDQIRKVIAEVKPSWVSDDVIEHDSLNCALISHLRGIYPPDERGQVVWLLTIDRTLKRAQRILYGGKEIQGPYCIQAQKWGEIVLPAQSLLGFVFKDFIGYLAQAKLGAIADPQVVQLDFLETVRDAEIDVDRLLGLHPDQVRVTLVRLQTNREARSLVTNAAKAQDEVQRKAYQQQFQLLLDEAVEETDPVNVVRREYDRKINLLKQHLKQRDLRIAELDTRLARAESTLRFRISSWLRRVLSRK